MRATRSSEPDVASMTSIPNLTEATKFLTLLTGEPDPVVTFQTFDDDEARKDPTLARVQAGRLSQVAPWLRSAQARGAGVFVAINEQNGQRRKNSDVVRIRALFVDCDGQASAGKSCPLIPTVRVISSPGRAHNYWVVTDGHAPTRFGAAQQALITYYDSDASVKDLARVMRLPGFSHLKDRKKPFQTCIEASNPNARYTIDQVLAAHRTSTKQSAKPPTLVKQRLPAPASAPYRDGIESYKRLVSGTPMIEGKRHNTLLGLAAEGHALGVPEEVIEVSIRESAERAGMTDAKEIDRILDWAVANAENFESSAKRPEADVQDLMGELETRAAIDDSHIAAEWLYGEGSRLACLDASGFARLQTRAKHLLRGHLSLNALVKIRREAAEQHRAAQSQSAINGGRVLDPEFPQASAQAFLRERYRDAKGRRTLHFYAESFFAFTGICYGARRDGAMRSELYGWLGDSFCDDGEPFPVDTTIVDQVLDALRAECYVDAAIMPTWIRPKKVSATDVIVFENGILVVSEFLADPTTPLRPHTPELLTTAALPFKFDPDATCPRWRAFLPQVLPKDPTAIRALKQWFGLNLVPDMSHHKIMLMLGVPRGGKGTAGRTLRELLGALSVATPSITSLAGRFGMVSLIGKLAAIFFDAHIGRGDGMVAMERIKSVSGEDPVEIEKKFGDANSVLLSSRFTLIANDMPHFGDDSGAVADRLIIVYFSESFAEKPDLTLGAALKAELPGILNWAIEGLIDLRMSGRLLQPASGQALLDDFRRLASPVRSFVEDCCELERDAVTPTRDLSAAYDTWAELNGHMRMAVETFSSRLRAAFPRLEHCRPGSRDSARTRAYRGIRISDSTLASPTEPGEGF